VWRSVVLGCVVVACGRVRFADHAGSGALDDASGADATPDGPPRSCATDSDCALCEGCDGGFCAKESIDLLALGHRVSCFLSYGGSRWCIGEYAGEGAATNVAPFRPLRLACDIGWTSLALGYGRSYGAHVGDLDSWLDDAAPTVDIAGGGATVVSVDESTQCFLDAGAVTCFGGSQLAGAWLEFAAGESFFCGVRSDHTLWCYGESERNCLGQALPDNTEVAAPEQVGTDTDWMNVAVGDTFGCAMKTDNTIWCWGNNAYTGTGFADTNGTPTQILPDTDWTSVEVRWHHACARKTDGTTVCWGGDEFGLQVVDSAAADANVGVPTAVATGVGFSQFWMGGHHYCGVESGTSTIRCWGWNAAGQLVNGDTATRDTFATSLPICTQAP